MKAFVFFVYTFVWNLHLKFVKWLGYFKVQNFLWWLFMQVCLSLCQLWWCRLAHHLQLINVSEVCTLNTSRLVSMWTHLLPIVVHCPLGLYVVSFERTHLKALRMQFAHTSIFMWEWTCISYIHSKSQSLVHLKTFNFTFMCGMQEYVWLLCVFLCAHSYLVVVCVVWASVAIMCILC